MDSRRGGAVVRMITRQSLANVAAERWAAQYSDGRYGPDKLVTLEGLRALGADPNPNDVDDLIGNKSWTRTTCGECGVENRDVAQIGDEPDYESLTAYVCLDCLHKAVLMFEAPQTAPPSSD